MVESKSWALTSLQQKAADRLIVSFDKPDAWAVRRVLPELSYSFHAFKMSQAVMNNRRAEAATGRRKGKMYLDAQLVGSPDVISENLRAVLSASRSFLPRYVSLHPAAEEEALKAAVDTVKEVVRGDYIIDLVLASVPSTLAFGEAKRSHGGRTPLETVRYHAELAKECGIRVMSCSGHLVSVAKHVSDDLVIIGDGVRFDDDPKGDHKHTLTPFEMLQEGADYLATGSSFVYDRDVVRAAGSVKRILNNVARYRPPA